MSDSKIAKKGSLIFTTGIVLNLCISILLFAGANFVTHKATERGKEALMLAKEEGFYLAQKLYSGYHKYIEKTGDKELREEEPSVLASQNSYDVIKYDLSLWFNIDAKTITGEFYMHASCVNDTISKIYLNLYDNLKVYSVSYLPLERHLTQGEDIRYAGEFRDANFLQNKNYVIIEPGEKLKTGGEFIVKINYSGTPKRVGFDSFSFKKIHDSMCIYSLSEPNYGPTWWPSKDLPDDKAFVSMRLNVPQGFKGVSNGILTDIARTSDSSTAYNWETKYPTATYLTSIVVSNFAYWEQTYTSVDGNKQMPVVYYVFPKDSVKSVYDWSITPDMIKFLSETFGEYPFIDEKYGMAQFGWTNGAMEHQTVTSMSYLLVTGDRKFDNVVVHELAHQWFGDAVTLKDWKNIWLNEGFASYCEALWEEHQNGRKAYFDYMKKFDYGYFSGTVYAPADFIDNYAVYTTIYNKGAWVLHMLRGIMGDSAFFAAAKEYYSRFKYGNAETSQLVEIMEQYYGQKLDWFFDEWVYKGTGRPKYEYSWKFEDFQGQKGSGNYTVNLQLKQVQKDDLDVYKMPLKITISSSNGEKEFTVFNDAKEQTFQFVTDSEPKEVFIDKDNWVLKKIAKGSYEK